jgi:hypothetical protein
MRLIVAAVSVSVLAGGCSKNPVLADPVTSTAGAGTLALSASAPVKIQTTDVLSAADGTTVYGAAHLVRSNNGLTVDVSTTNLVPGDVYTL